LEAFVVLSRKTVWAVASPHPIPKAVKIIYDGTLEVSKARELFVDFYTEHGGERLLPSDLDIPQRFLHDLSINLLRRRSLQGLKLTSSCPLSTYDEVTSEETKVATTELTPTKEYDH
jgi:hypothetical protein